MSAPSQTNLLRQLEAKIRGLPVQDALLRRRETYRNTRAEAQQHRAALELALKQIEALRTIQGRTDLLSEIQEKRLGTVRSRAREISTLLNAPAPENRKFSEKLEQIKRAVSSLSDEITEAWRQVGEEHRNRAIAFRTIAQRVNQSLGHRIQELDRVLGQGSTPPTDGKQVRAIAEARMALNSEIAALAIDGPVESFLKDAQAGKGDARALLDPHVRSYLDAHPQLWSFLRVVLA